MSNRNVLSERYSSPEINRIFSPEGTILAERDLWISIMKAQKELGFGIPAEDIEKFERAKNDIDSERIRKIEIITKHDVKARIQDFVNISGAGEYLHLGMTSKDLTDNTEQMQIRDASRIIFGKNISAVRHLSEKAQEYEGIILAARTHTQPAQVTLLGRRISMSAEELLKHLGPFERFIEDYPLRGIKGAVGTQSDMLKILGSREKVEGLERIVAEYLGFKTVLSSPGQVYPRSFDLALASHLVNLSAAYENFTNNIRLMAGFELVTEGFEEGQVGSSAMPHKINTPHSERVKGLGNVMKGYQDMLSRISGEQWQEGDVSDSVVRRVAIPDLFYSADGQLETVLNIFNKMGAYPAVIRKELMTYLPFLATGQILAEAISRGIGREDAHAAIRRNTVAESLMRRATGETPKVLEKLAADPVFSNKGIGRDILIQVVSKWEDLLGSAKQQIEKVVKESKYWTDKYSKEASYEPREIL
ncbi:adenylosuccinate lyase [Candidatus Pacearchaeota archaeon]|nr:adenylosuccinate lyase [Candidatus Pacearchaeota archaeon]